MSWSCSGVKPNYDNFWNNYLYYANICVPALEVSRSFLLGVWYQEWGIPYNNPGNLIGTEGYTPAGYCGNFPAFDTLEDGAQAFVTLFNRRYNGESTSYSNIFGQLNNVKNAYNNGFTGGLTASSVKTDDGDYINVTSVAFGGKSQSGGTILTATYAANEMFGSTAWNAGHYIRNRSPYNDYYPGQRLNAVLNSSGWAAKEALLP
ncbi:hypothetical protein [Paenibacillus planticolens]|uniref:Uncharacterized protein n=1 Tax=Paenibacillus planticolens TaxID=2654976 RepID=A0ABX1ZID8_9BACL|nr:hypothetical protein [Paenibacillus planticolens]NOU99844.1 hypothetical protein [Paenibacillus planticolens]